MEVLQRTANRGSISTGYDIDNSLKLEADNSEYLIKTSDAGTNRKTFTVSMWFKRTELADDYMQLWQGGQFGEATRLGFYGGTPKEAIWVDIGGGTGTTGGSSNSGINYRSYSNQVLRDTSAWYHIVLAVDTTQATEANRWRLWLNGEEVTSWSQRQYPVQDYQCALEPGINMHWGAYNATYYKMSGYIAECHYLDGVTAVQTDFGEYDEDSGIWKPKAYAGSYGGNGCYLNFDDSSDLGADSSGNSNNFTLNNITSADQATDTPTNNFCIANAIAIGTSNLFQFTEGGTVCKRITADQWDFFTTTMPVNKGKWYGEFKIGAGPAMVGIGSLSYFEGIAQSSHTGAGMATNSGVAYYGADGKRWVDGTEAAYGATFGTSDIISIAMDLDNDNVYFAKNGTWQNSGDPTSGATGTGALSTDPVGDYFVMTMNMLYNPTTHFMNYGGYTTISISSAASDGNGYGTFEYAPPSGYYALCTKNLAEFG